MAARISGLPTTAEGGWVAGVLKAITGLADRVKRLEGIVHNQTAPADCRFERTIDPDTGELSVWIVRVSTGNREKIAGPL